MKPKRNRRGQFERCANVEGTRVNLGLQLDERREMKLNGKRVELPPCCWPEGPGKKMVILYA